jgi:hypothetical protein
MTSTPQYAIVGAGTVGTDDAIAHGGGSSGELSRI